MLEWFWTLMNPGAALSKQFQEATKYAPAKAVENTFSLPELGEMGTYARQRASGAGNSIFTKIGFIGSLLLMFFYRGGESPTVESTSIAQDAQGLFRGVFTFLSFGSIVFIAFIFLLFCAVFGPEAVLEHLLTPIFNLVNYLAS